MTEEHIMTLSSLVEKALAASTPLTGQGTDAASIYAPILQAYSALHQVLISGCGEIPLRKTMLPNISNQARLLTPVGQVTIYLEVKDSVKIDIARYIYKDIPFFPSLNQSKRFLYLSILSYRKSLPKKGSAADPHERPLNIDVRGRGEILTWYHASLEEVLRTIVERKDGPSLTTLSRLPVIVLEGFQILQRNEQIGVTWESHALPESRKSCHAFHAQLKHILLQNMNPELFQACLAKLPEDEKIGILAGLLREASDEQLARLRTYFEGDTRTQSLLNEALRPLLAEKAN